MREVERRQARAAFEHEAHIRHVVSLEGRQVERRQAQGIVDDADKREKQTQQRIAAAEKQAQEILDNANLDADDIRSQAQDDAQDIRAKANQFFKLNQEEAQKELKRAEQVRKEAEDEKAKAQAAQKQVERKAQNLYLSLIEAVRRRMRSRVESVVDRFSDPVKVAVMKAFDGVFEYFKSSGEEVINGVVNEPIKHAWMKDPDNLPTGVNYAAHPNDDNQYD